MSRVLFSVALLISSCLANAAFAQCPSDTIRCASSPAATLVTSEPGYSCVGPWNAAQVACPGACYDLKEGELAVTGGPGPVAWSREVVARDEYWLSGPSAPPLTFQVHLRVEGTLPSGAQGWAAVEDSETVRVVFLLGPYPPDDSAVFSLSHAPGEPFSLQLTLSVLSTGGSLTDVRARLGFEGLPPGYAILSCQGYGAAVPVQGSTWGEIKARYR